MVDIEGKAVVALTIQQQAYRMIDGITDEGVAAVIHVMKNMVQKAPDSTEAEEQSRRARAYERMEELRKESSRYAADDLGKE